MSERSRRRREERRLLQSGEVTEPPLISEGEFLGISQLANLTTRLILQRNPKADEVIDFMLGYESTIEEKAKIKAYTRANFTVIKDG